MGHCTSLNTNVLIKTREESFKKRYFFITHKYYVPFYTHTMRETERERERDYVLQSTVGSRGTGTLTLQSWGSCFSLSGIICNAFAAVSKHSHKDLRIVVVFACCDTFCTPLQHIGLGDGPKPRKYGLQVINCVKASSHVMPSEGLALAFRTKIIINPKANTKQLIVFFSILFWIEHYCEVKN